MVANFGGAAVTAVFPARPGGATVAARRAVQCALDLQAAMASFRAVATTAWAFALAMRAGVAAGATLLAVVGDRAARLEHLVAGGAGGPAPAASRPPGRGEVAVDPALAASDLGVEFGERRGGAAVVARLARRPRRPPRPAAAALPDDGGPAGVLHPA